MIVFRFGLILFLFPFPFLFVIVSVLMIVIRQFSQALKNRIEEVNKNAQNNLTAVNIRIGESTDKVRFNPLFIPIFFVIVSVLMIVFRFFLFPFSVSLFHF